MEYYVANGGNDHINQSKMEVVLAALAAGNYTFIMIHRKYCMMR